MGLLAHRAFFFTPYRPLVGYDDRMSGVQPAEAWPCPKSVYQLVLRLERHKGSSSSQSTIGSAVGGEFIESFFGSLGWDVDTVAGQDQVRRDLSDEEAIKSAGQAKAPDYCFGVGGDRLFFVEAQAPSVGVKGGPGPAYQIRRYAWSAKHPLAIVTDFRGLAVYDCRIRPRPKDKPSTALVLHLTCDEYPRRWGEIASMFSRKAVLEGSLGRYAESIRRRGSAGDVESVLLADIEHWSGLLADGIALGNAGLSAGDLNYAVGKIIDRIIFLRMGEERGAEPYAQLRSLSTGPGVYSRLLSVFRRAEERYNSGLFHFRTERGKPDGPDRLTPGLVIGDGVLREIIGGLYYPECPYEFSVLPVEILGRVYEQFLGKVIRPTKGRRAVVEEKPEVRKAGGVYYTPGFIVEYLVEHTVGKLLEGRTVKWVGRERGKKVNGPRLDMPLRVLDPACGSGSFLLGAYRCLLRWYLDYYTTNDPAGWTGRADPPILEPANPRAAIRGPRSSFRLSIAERERILREHIYGVDVDPQAVEVAKLSLLLEALDGESRRIPGNERGAFGERAMPDLAGRIKCGHSLIGPDFHDDRRAMRGDAERGRVKVFDWGAEFPEVFDEGEAGHQSRDRKGSPGGCGFDAVIGNPPYLSFSGRQAVGLSQKERAYFAEHYEAGGWVTSHGLFMERSVRDLSRRFAAFIVPDQVGHLDGYGPLRETIGRYAGLVEVRYWGEAVFPGVVTPALTLVADRAYRGETLIRQSDSAPGCGVRCESADPWVGPAMGSLLPKLRQESYSLGALVADPGVHTGNCSRKLVLPAGQSAPGCVAVLEGKQIAPYQCQRPSKVLRLDYRPEEGEYFTIKPKDRYAEALFVIRQTAGHPIVGPREGADYFRNSLLALYSPRDGTDVRYLVGLLNSRLLRWVYRQTVQESRQEIFPQVKVRSIRELPIRRLDLADPQDKDKHDRMVKLVQQMLDLHRQLATATTSTDRSAVQRRIDSTDKRIDQLVFELYDLTDDEARCC